MEGQINRVKWGNTGACIVEGETEGWELVHAAFVRGEKSY